MSTSTRALLTALRDQLLGFTPQTGTGLGDFLGDRLYIIQAPDDAVYPYGLLRLINRIETPGFGGYRETGDVELMLLHRGRGYQWDMEDALDGVDQAMLNWWAVTDGGQWTGPRVRDMLPAAPEPMDRELVQGRWVCGYRSWLTYLTQYLDA